MLLLTWCFHCLNGIDIGIEHSFPHICPKIHMAQFCKVRACYKSISNRDFELKKKIYLRLWNGKKSEKATRTMLLKPWVHYILNFETPLGLFLIGIKYLFYRYKIFRYKIFKWKIFYYYSSIWFDYICLQKSCNKTVCYKFHYILMYTDSEIYIQDWQNCPFKDSVQGSWLWTWFLSTQKDLFLLSFGCLNLQSECLSSSVSL